MSTTNYYKQSKLTSQVTDTLGLSLLFRHVYRADFSFGAARKDAAW